MKKTALLLAMLFAFTCLPLGASFSAVGEAEAERLTATVSVPNGREKEAVLLTDGYASTYVAFKSNDTVRFAFSGEASHLVTEWEIEPERVTLSCFAGETKLSDAELSVPFLSTVTGLPAGTTAVELTFVQKNGTANLSEVRAYGAGELPETEYRWKSAENPDVLLVVAFPGDEYRFFGGLLPKLISDGANVAVCYFSDYSRARLEEGLSALHAFGLNTYPVRLGIKAKLSLDYQELKKNWKDAKPEKLFEQQLAALRPTVVIAPSAKEAAPEARLVSEIVQDICKKHSGSYQKLYLAESADNATVVLDEALPLFGGQSANELARHALKGFRSVDFWEYTIRTEGAYKLVQTRVGSDQKKDSLFEHLTIELNPPAVPTPVPTDTPEPTEAPTEEPTEMPTEAPTDAPVGTPANASSTLTIEDEIVEPAETPTPVPTGTPQKRGWLSCAGKEITPAPTEVPATPVPTEAPTPKPTEAPTPEPTELPTLPPTPTPVPTPEPTPVPTPTPEPEKFAGHFLEEGEPEQFTMDRENGHWTFRDQSTDMDIRRVDTKDRDGSPQIYFVAHIWMRANQHRSGFGHESRNGRTREKLYGIARRYGAVLAITGDNMFNFDEAWSLKSTSIRDGYLYYDKTGATVMAWNERTLSFDLYENNSFTAAELLEKGYREVYCFGPILMQNGQIMSRLRFTPHCDADFKRPRVGVGQVEPGHFVIIVADGKNPGKASGYNLEEYAALFQAEGCVSAYNLDGGMSADIVFMGVHLRERPDKRNLPDALLFGHTDLLPAENDPAPERYEVGVDENGRTVFVPKKGK